MPRLLSIPNAFLTSNSNFGISVHSHPRPEVAGYLARRVFQGWRATSGRALRMISRLFANGTVKIRIAAFLTVSFCAALAARAQLGVTSIRQPGAPLDVSLRQEVEHAIDLAASWLAARQNADGSWGSETGRLWRTSVTLLALSARADRHSDAVARAAVWLDAQQPAPHASPDLHAWRLLALFSATPDTPARSNLVGRLIRAAPAQPSEGSPSSGPDLWLEAQAIVGHTPPPPPSKRELHMLDVTRRGWPDMASAPPLCVWPYIHVINRTGGTLERDGTRFDWRRDVAQNIISAQRREPAGGAYWGPADGDSRIERTAFGILTAQEL